jgi:hypothetical protein
MLFFCRYITASLVIRLKKSITSVGVNLDKDKGIYDFITVNFYDVFIRQSSVAVMFSARILPVPGSHLVHAIGYHD